MQDLSPADMVDWMLREPRFSARIEVGQEGTCAWAVPYIDDPRLDSVVPLGEWLAQLKVYISQERDARA